MPSETVDLGYVRGDTGPQGPTGPTGPQGDPATVPTTDLENFQGYIGFDEAASSTATGNEFAPLSQLKAMFDNIKVSIDEANSLPLTIGRFTHNATLNLPPGSTQVVSIPCDPRKTIIESIHMYVTDGALDPMYTYGFTIEPDSDNHGISLNFTGINGSGPSIPVIPGRPDWSSTTSEDYLYIFNLDVYLAAFK